MVSVDTYNCFGPCDYMQRMDAHYTTFHGASYWGNFSDRWALLRVGCNPCGDALDRLDNFGIFTLTITVQSFHRSIVQ